MWLVLGSMYGLVIGALPALGVVYALALILPITFRLPPDTAIILLASTQAACVFGDSIASILMNTPGGPSSVASCWDGYPLARQGKGGMALGLSATGAVFGGIIGWVFVALVSPVIAEVALRFGAPEYFVVCLVAIAMVSVLSRGNLIKGIILGSFGLFLSSIGQDPMTGVERFTFGLEYLIDGIPFVPVTLGLFAVGQAIRLAVEGSSTIAEVVVPDDSPWKGVLEAIRRPIAILRAAVVGLWMGVLPVLGANTANVLAYAVEKNSSKDPASFGKGNPAGLLAADTAKSACILGDLVPTFCLGIPGSPGTALFLAALLLQGIQPGPSFFSKGELPYTILAGILLSQFAFFIIGMVVLRYMAYVARVPCPILVPLMVILGVLGAYAERNDMRDVLLMIGFGIAGYVWEQRGYPLMCLVLGMILGRITEINLERSLILGHGSWLIFFTRPISLVLIVFLCGYMAWPYITAVRSLRLYHLFWSRRSAN